ncbi:pyridoxamine 5'-phosphate oxidase family protein [Eubacteriales bacterium OttesenSCG-928-G02]|nr:pyridoxamine 5'-phosphate oxidase family protein [Eubacteriales bacterium OttesenSCG-928-G02]
MRRQDREVTNLFEIEEIIKECDCCRIALIDKDYPYIIPLNFGYEYINNNFVFYFHCAAEGKKIELIKNNSRAGFELDTRHKLVLSENSCGCSYKYASIVGGGKIELITNELEKIKALNSLMYKYTGKKIISLTKKYY